MSEAAVKKGRYNRYSPEERRKMIIDGAIEFFSEQGFDGSTHQLAKYLGVTQPLIYQYFPSKEDLVEAVYMSLFQDRWNDEWEDILRDRTRPIQDRLTDFYSRYIAIVHTSEWIRIFLHSGLKNMEIARRYTPIIERRVITRICAEMRAALGLQDFANCALTDEEFEAAWMLHGGIFYNGVRRSVYRVPVKADVDALIRGTVLTYVSGAKGLAEHLGIKPAKPG